MKKYLMVFLSIFILAGCTNEKKFKDSSYIIFDDASIKPDYVELKKSDREIWFAFYYRNDYSYTSKAPFSSKNIEISAFQEDKQLEMSKKTIDDFSDNLSSINQRIETHEENFMIFIFETDDFKTPITFKFNQLEGKSEKVSINL